MPMLHRWKAQGQVDAGLVDSVTFSEDQALKEIEEALAVELTGRGHLICHVEALQVFCRSYRGCSFRLRVV